jgi:hypothetical protein
MVLFSKTHANVLVCSLLALAAARFLPAQESPTTTVTDVDVTWGVKIPMRDGVHLNATVYRPHNQKQPRRIFRATAMCMHLWMCAGEGAPREPSNLLRTRAATAMTSPSGLPHNPIAMKKSLCLPPDGQGQPVAIAGFQHQYAVG